MISFIKSLFRRKPLPSKSGLPPVHPSDVLLYDFLQVDPSRPVDVKGLSETLEVWSGIDKWYWGQFLEGKAPLDTPCCQALADRFGTTREFWVNLQRRYEVQVYRQKRGESWNQ